METYKLSTSCGSNFTSVSEKAKQIAIERNVIVEFEFNGVTCLVSKNGFNVIIQIHGLWNGKP